jgi:dTMP kinase
MFISFEGIEGSGKTTHVKHTVRFLQDKGHDCVITREPGGTRIGEKIRAILLDPLSKDMNPLTEFLLYMADRAQHIKNVFFRYCPTARWSCVIAIMTPPWLIRDLQEGWISD